MKFEWNDDKNEINKLKHGISFEAALMIFQTEYIVLGSRIVNGEKRELVLGTLAERGVILVVTTDRNNVTRLISARKASRKERSFYYASKKSIA